MLLLSFSDATSTVSSEFAPKLLLDVFFICEDPFLSNCDFLMRLVSLQPAAAEPRSASSS